MSRVNEFSNFSFLCLFIYHSGFFGDYSEQFLVDCGWGYTDENQNNLNNGCKGAASNGYAKWLVDNKPELSSESAYPYTVNNNLELFKQNLVFNT